MHSLVRRFLKTGIVFLMVGLLLGGWMVVQRELWLLPPGPYLVSAHTHALLVGFVMMMILGVALWLFPRPAREDRRYSPARVELSYWLLAGGTATRVVLELLRATSPALWLRWGVVLASFAQIAAILIFFATMWSRIRPLGSKAREAAGERF